MDQTTILSMLHGTLGIKKNVIALQRSQHEPAGIDSIRGHEQYLLHDGGSY